MSTKRDEFEAGLTQRKGKEEVIPQQGEKTVSSDYEVAEMLEKSMSEEMTAVSTYDFRIRRIRQLSLFGKRYEGLVNKLKEIIRDEQDHYNIFKNELDKIKP